MMVAHLTESLPRSLDCDNLVVVGKLTKKSTDTLPEHAYVKTQGYSTVWRSKNVVKLLQTGKHQFRSRTTVY